MEDRQREGRSAIVENHIKSLMTIFDTVQIFCSKYEPENGETTYFTSGDGNIFARIGQSTLWIERQKQIGRDSAEKNND